MSKPNMLPHEGGSILEKLLREHAGTNRNETSPHTVRITRGMVPPFAYIYHNDEWIGTDRWAIRKRYIRRKAGFSILGQVMRFVDIPEVQRMEDSGFWPAIAGTAKPLDVSRADATDWIYEATLSAGVPATRLYRDFLTRHIYFPNAAAVALGAFRILILQTSSKDCVGVVANAEEVVAVMMGRYGEVADGDLPPGVKPPIDFKQDSPFLEEGEQ